ncbi:MAG: leucine-rich repeat domain-containing protein, partial [Oscillospiraceae bacterium]|nr:leucine-rich repeat domain-containing protein [Oscillospiraceae bacterium]
LIEYANEKGKTEAAAWLLDFKNRTADLAAERTRAEKKAERELNADPNSLTELKKIWRFESNGNGTIIITGYKGDRREIAVPEKIGDNIVTALGEYAFSPDAKRIREEQRAVRRAITKVTLPDTIESIGEFAFFKCKSLTEINIPEKLAEISKGMLDITCLESIVIGGNVKKIGGVAFWGCRDLKYVKLCDGVVEIDVGAFYNCTGLETIELPRSLKKAAPHTMSEGSFWNCINLTALVHKDSYAEKYCEENKINYKYTEE